MINRWLIFPHLFNLKLKLDTCMLLLNFQMTKWQYLRSITATTLAPGGDPFHGRSLSKKCLLKAHQLFSANGHFWVKWFHQHSNLDSYVPIYFPSKKSGSCSSIFSWIKSLLFDTHFFTWHLIIYFRRFLGLMLRWMYFSGKT